MEPNQKQPDELKATEAEATEHATEAVESAGDALADAEEGSTEG